MTEHEMPLITTLSFGLVMAFMFGLVAVRLRLPPIVGYLLAGVFLGPYTPGFVADAEIAKQLSEVGIVLLMFGVGLHFSLKDLWEVKKIAITGSLCPDCGFSGHRIGAGSSMGLETGGRICLWSGLFGCQYGCDCTCAPWKTTIFYTVPSEKLLWVG